MPELSKAIYREGVQEGAPGVISLSGKATVQTQKVAIGPLTDAIRIEVARPTSTNNVRWAEGTVLRATISVLVDGERVSGLGVTFGGIGLRNTDGSEALFCHLQHGTTNRQLPDRVYRSGELARTSYEAFVEFTLEAGDEIETELLSVRTTESPAPTREHHNSVAYDADTPNSASFVDTITVSHAPTGTTDLAVFGSVAVGSVSVGTSTATYDGSAMTELFDATNSATLEVAGYVRVLGSDNASKDMVVTLSSFRQAVAANVMSFTGVDQTTPTGTVPTPTSGSGTAPSITAASVATDDMVVDVLAVVGTALPTVGADQTEQWFYDNLATLSYSMGGSTQPGSAGGVMEWDTASGAWLQGGVRYIAAAGAGGIVGPLIGGHLTRGGPLLGRLVR